MTFYIVAVVCLVIGAVIGFFVRHFLLTKKFKQLETKQRELLINAKDEALKIKERAEKERELKLKDLNDRERSLIRREENIELRLERIERDKEQLDKDLKAVKENKAKVDQLIMERRKALEKASKLKSKDAKEELLKEVEKEYKDEIIRKVKEMKEWLKENSEEEAKKIITSVIDRISNDFTAEHTTFAVHIPSEEMKGRIIGKEGRNIQAFERATGVDLVIDETPDTVLLSSFDPVRRHVAKVALERLVSDGRIQPSRIEEVVKKTQEDIKKEAREAGEKAVFDLGIHSLPQDLIKIIGNLKFRTSYGQNVLAHSVEVANIAVLLAAEIGADVNIVKKAGILHDIGKAVSHEVQGPHHHISAEIAKK